MSEKLAAVLGIDPNNAKPSAYELLGLPSGESDPARIAAAVEATVQRLKRSRSETDQAIWKQAAAAVSKAHKLLVDPKAKAAYDAKLKRASAAKSRLRGEAKHDPLRGLLPSMDPLAPFDVDAAARRASIEREFQPPPLPPPIVVTENDGPDSDDATAAIQNLTEQQPAEHPIAGFAPASLDASVAPRSSSPGPRSSVRRRRRGSPLLVMVLGLLMLGMLGGVAWGVYTLVQREQARAGAGTLAQGNQNAATPRAAMPRAPRPPADAVMGNLAGGSSAPAPNLDSLPPLQSNIDVEMPPPFMANTPETPESPETPNMPEPAAGNPAEPAGSEPEMMEPTTPPPPAEPSEAQLQAGQAAIEAAETALRNHDWKRMKPLAESARAAAADEAQKQLATELFEVADLADYYYNGIVKALEDLPSGNTFMLAEGVEVAVVEASATQLILQVQGRPKAFPFDEMPFILAHKLGSFTMATEDPMVQAAKAVFQSLAKNARASDRQQAAGWLKELPEEVNGSHPHQIVQTIERLFPAE